MVEKYVENITEEICKDSIYAYVEGELGLKIAYAKKEITVQFATEEDKKYLDLKKFDMVVVVKSYTYLDDTSLPNLDIDQINLNLLTLHEEKNKYRGLLTKQEYSLS